MSGPASSPALADAAPLGLGRLDALPAAVGRPSYARTDLSAGIVHFRSRQLPPRPPGGLPRSADGVGAGPRLGHRRRERHARGRGAARHAPGSGPAHHRRVRVRRDERGARDGPDARLPARRRCTGDPRRPRGPRDPDRVAHRHRGWLLRLGRDEPLRRRAPAHPRGRREPRRPGDRVRADRGGPSRRGARPDAPPSPSCRATTCRTTASPRAPPSRGSPGSPTRSSPTGSTRTRASRTAWSTGSRPRRVRASARAPPASSASRTRRPCSARTTSSGCSRTTSSPGAPRSRRSGCRSSTTSRRTRR